MQYILQFFRLFSSYTITNLFPTNIILKRAKRVVTSNIKLCWHSSTPDCSLQGHYVIRLKLNFKHLKEIKNNNFSFILLVWH